MESGLSDGSRLIVIQPNCACTGAYYILQIGLYSILHNVRF